MITARSRAVPRSVKRWAQAVSAVGLLSLVATLAAAQDVERSPDRGVAARPGSFTSADFAEHLRVLRPKIPATGFTIVIVPPFVVLGDESPEVVRRRSRETVKWAVDRLKEAYFTKDPKEILDIWLFKDKASYLEHCKSIFHKTPDTPYGYFSHVDRALVMNIGTGGGTLVHEIVHPFVAANFPECPTWLNEGLGSLYEQSGGERAAGSAATRTGGWPVFRRRSGRNDSPRFKRSRRRPKTSSMRRTRGRITPRPDICVIISSNKVCCGSSITGSTPIAARIRPATARSRPCWAARTWTFSSRSGKRTC